MKRLNKKGFTLVELLAVIVILAILLVVVGTTALPAMNNAKKRTLILYAQRMQAKAQEMYSLENNFASGSETYDVDTLMGIGEDYEGAVIVEYNSSTQKYTTTIANKDDNGNDIRVSDGTLCITAGKDVSALTTDDVGDC